MQPKNNIYFLSDFHLGAPNAAASLIREKKIISFLESIEKDAKEIFLVGDLFDFWFEYKAVVPKGFVRFLGCLAKLSDIGIKLHIFTGNHDMWMKDYLSKEINCIIYNDPQTFIFNNKHFFIGHGDGLGPKDYKYKFIKKVFRNPISKFLFSIFPPALGVGLANYFSQKSRYAEKDIATSKTFLGEKNEWLIQYCFKKLIQIPNINYFIFGHRHLPIHFKLSETAKYINLGEWINDCTYAKWDGKTLKLLNADTEDEIKQF